MPMLCFWEEEAKETREGRKSQPGHVKACTVTAGIPQAEFLLQSRQLSNLMGSLSLAPWGKNQSSGPGPVTSVDTETSRNCDFPKGGSARAITVGRVDKQETFRLESLFQDSTLGGLFNYNASNFITEEIFVPF